MATGAPVTVGQFIEGLEERSGVGGHLGMLDLSRQYLDEVLATCSDGEADRIDHLLRNAQLLSGVRTPRRATQDAA